MEGILKGGGMKKNRVLRIFSLLMVTFSLVACGENNDESSQEATSEESVETSGEFEVSDESKEESTDAEESVGGLIAGTYTATAPGMNGDVNVEVEVNDDEIVNVTVTDHLETPGIGGELLDSEGEPVSAGVNIPVTDIPEKIVETQNINVDSITGATITSSAVKNAVSDAIEQAGGNPDDWSAEVEHTQDSEDITSDIVIVGGGGSGLAGAITAAQQGKTVTIIEKNGSIGGNTLVCGAIYNTPNPETQSQVEMTQPVKDTLEQALAEEPVDDDHAELQAIVQEQWDQYNTEGRTDLFDSNEWFALQTWNGGDKVGDLDLVKTLTYQSYPGFEWIQELGMGFDPQVGQGAGALWQRTHTSTMDMGTGFISTYSRQIENYPEEINVLTETTATSLLLEGNQVVGVNVKDNLSGQEYVISANDGVILTTGGFGANGEMVEEYNTSGKWDDLSEVVTTNRETVSQGDGINMGLEAGASLTDMDQIQLLYLGNLENGQLTKYPPRDVNGTDQIIFINKEGERFTNEGGRRDDISKASLEQTDGYFYMLESADGDMYVDIDDPEWRSGDGFTFDYLLENDYIIVGETLDDIAEQIGCNPETLKQTVADFNESVETGEDEFGRTLFSTKLENGPWVATPRQASIHHTMGGLTIDVDGRVLDEAGEPIPGLYAGGEVTGGVHGANRLGGNAVVDTVVFGKEAADTLIQDAGGGTTIEESTEVTSSEESSEE